MLLKGKYEWEKIHQDGFHGSEADVVVYFTKHFQLPVLSRAKKLLIIISETKSNEEKRFLSRAMTEKLITVFYKLSSDQIMKSD